MVRLARVPGRSRTDGRAQQPEQGRGVRPRRCPCGLAGEGPRCRTFAVAEHERRVEPDLAHQAEGLLEVFLGFVVEAGEHVGGYAADARVGSLVKVRVVDATAATLLGELV